MRCPACGDRFGGCFACKPPEVKFEGGVKFVAKVRTCWINEPGCNCMVDGKAKDAPAPSVALPAAPQETALECAIRTLRANGFKPEDNPRFLGAGVYGKTYVLSDDRVFKITRDRTDALTAAWAMRYQKRGLCPNLVRVDRVWKLSAKSAYDDTLYLIVAERLKPIPRAAFEKWGAPSYMGSLGECKRDLIVIADRWANGTMPPITRYNYEIRNYERVAPNVWAWAAMNLKGIADDLRLMGIRDYGDYHLENVMIRPGDRVVLSDFGSATAPPVDIEEANAAAA